MNRAPNAAMRTNPFSTRFTRPGAIDYLFPPGENGPAVIDRLRQNNWRGEIVGPHGSGKSTLLVALEPALAAAGRVPWRTRLRDEQRAMPLGWKIEASKVRANLIVIDGYEQLSCWNRWRVQCVCRRKAWGLLVTAHGPTGLPRLFETTANLADLQRIVETLLSGTYDSIEPEVVARQYQASGGNARETLFSLYDEWERRSRQSGRGR